MISPILMHLCAVIELFLKERVGLYAPDSSMAQRYERALLALNVLKDELRGL
jgi:hypothetical protein